MRKKAVNLTLSDEIRARAQSVMIHRGFSSFSAYVEQLIRDEYERIRISEAPKVAAFMDYAAKTAPVNSAASPEFQAIFDAGVAAATARGAQGGKPLPVQSVSYLAPAQKGRKSPRKPLKK